jgi:hypothetical protein
LKGYRVKDFITEKRIYAPCMMKTAKIFNDLIKDKELTIDQFLDDSENGVKKETILQVFLSIYKNEEEHITPYVRSAFVPLKGLRNTLGDQQYQDALQAAASA